MLDGCCPPPCGKQQFRKEYLAVLQCLGLALEGRLTVWYRSEACYCWHITHGRAKGSKARSVARWLPR